MPHARWFVAAFQPAAGSLSHFSREDGRCAHRARRKNKVLEKRVSSIEFSSMRSQKQNNRAPRPFKNQNSAGRWSGGNGGFIPGQKSPPPVKKAVSVPPERPKS
jgi:hypothetical protein